jgi:hypothetical protein
VLFRAAVAEEQSALDRLHEQDKIALYARLGLSEAELAAVDRQRRTRRGLEGESGCAVLIAVIGAGAVIAALI